jgi:NAD(P)-dependent dehydrogenase (short-subunit alcohol dehydrogenase family)
MMSEFEGRVSIVSGGTRGIGRAIVRRLLESGFHVALISRSAEELESAEAELSGAGPGRALGIPGDVRSPDSCSSVVERVVDAFGGLDLLVNNAGVGIFAPVQEMSLEDWRVQIDTNLSGVFYLSRAAIPHLVRSNDAWIVNIGSLAGRNTFTGGAAYNASKFGLLGMTEAMMLDLRYEGIRVSHIMPGSVDTGFGQRPAGEKSGWALTPDDVARALLDLLRYPGNAHPSRIELRPSQPPRKS